ncbi:MAG: hypothetical protein H0W76_06215 [Pyrinomonadaceae bacterium]|nr:hypothetical protein [Pyrinomonadaceae bacterium]
MPNPALNIQSSQDTLDACTAENVAQMKQVITSIFQQQSQAVQHDYQAALQLLNIEMSGLPCGPQAELSTKGYFLPEAIAICTCIAPIIAPI